MHYDFIEIGTADFDTLVEQDWPEDVRGICVEPRADLLANLIDRVNVIKVNAAISSEDGFAPLCYVEIEEFLKDAGVIVHYFRGISMLYNWHPGVLTWVEEGHIPESAVKEQMVTVGTWPTFASTYDITAIGYLKIDTAGHDIVILRQYFEYCAKNPACLADVIEFEMQTHVWGDLIYEAVDRLESLGYTMNCLSDAQRAIFDKKEQPMLVFGETDLVVDNSIKAV